MLNISTKWSHTTLFSNSASNTSCRILSTSSFYIICFKLIFKPKLSFFYNAKLNNCQLYMEYMLYYSSSALSQLHRLNQRLTVVNSFCFCYKWLVFLRLHSSIAVKLLFPIKLGSACCDAGHQFFIQKSTQDTWLLGTIHAQLLVINKLLLTKCRYVLQQYFLKSEISPQ